MGSCVKERPSALFGSMQGYIGPKKPVGGCEDTLGATCVRQGRGASLITEPPGVNELYE